MSTLKTLPTTQNPREFLGQLDDERKKSDALVLLQLFERVTGEKPRMWGTSIIGFGLYHYKSERSRQEGDWPLVAFSPRKQSLTLYIMVDAKEYKNLLPKLGKYSCSANSCLYIKKLADVDLMVLEKLISIAYKHAKSTLT
ncbi:MAG: DUF1801 domain-containing protein [Candidatus Dojkabacteria bacterium]|nr:MAG: DUF1801 domain-containing protein [Candidatus Dojkabacteria bacterium]